MADVTVAMDRLHVAELRNEVQAALSEPEPAVAFVGVLTARGMRDLPTFAYVGIEGPAVRVLLRGDLVAVVRTPTGESSVVDASAVRTWTEVVLHDCDEVEIRSLPGGDDDIVTVVSIQAREESPNPPVPPPVSAVAEAASPSDLGDETMLPTPELLDELAAVAAAAAQAGVDPASEEASREPTAVGPSDVSASDDVDLSHLFETSYVGVEAAAVRSEDEIVEVPETSEPPAPPDPVDIPDVRPDLSLLPPPSGPPIAVRPPTLISGVPSSPPPPPPGGSSLGDHDGLTVGPAELAAIRAQVGAAPSAPSQPSGSQVQAVTCPSGHLNPPHAERCRGCDSAIADRSIRLVARPSLGRLVFGSGLVSEIDRPLRIGRKPTTEGLAPGAEVPGLVVLPDPEGSLSRVHAEVRIDGWEVLLVDQNSTNGTLVQLPGQAPVRLRPLEPCLLAAGTTITFADVSSCRFETGPR